MCEIKERVELCPRDLSRERKHLILSAGNVFNFHLHPGQDLGKNHLEQGRKEKGTIQFILDRGNFCQ